MNIHALVLTLYWDPSSAHVVYSSTSVYRDQDVPTSRCVLFYLIWKIQDVLTD